MEEDSLNNIFQNPIIQHEPEIPSDRKKWYKRLFKSRRYINDNKTAMKLAEYMRELVSCVDLTEAITKTLKIFDFLLGEKIKGAVFKITTIDKLIHEQKFGNCYHLPDKTLNLKPLQVNENKILMFRYIDDYIFLHIMMDCKHKPNTDSLKWLEYTLCLLNNYLQTTVLSHFSLDAQMSLPSEVYQALRSNLICEKESPNVIVLVMKIRGTTDNSFRHCHTIHTEFDKLLRYRGFKMSIFGSYYIAMYLNQSPDYAITDSLNVMKFADNLDNIKISISITTLNTTLEVIGVCNPRMRIKDDLNLTEGKYNHIHICETTQENIVSEIIKNMQWVNGYLEVKSDPKIVGEIRRRS